MGNAYDAIEPISLHRSPSCGAILRICELPSVPPGVCAVHEGGRGIVVSEGPRGVAACVGVVHDEAVAMNEEKGNDDEVINLLSIKYTAQTDNRRAFHPGVPFQLPSGGLIRDAVGVGFVCCGVDRRISRLSYRQSIVVCFILHVLNTHSPMPCLPLSTNHQNEQTAASESHTCPPSSPPATQPQTWADYLKRLTRRDNAIGITRTWVKKGRTGSHGEVAGKGGEAVGNVTTEM